jgi:GTPase-activator protein for Ras-like GTPase/C2 domain
MAGRGASELPVDIQKEVRVRVKVCEAEHLPIPLWSSPGASSGALNRGGGGDSKGSGAWDALRDVFSFDITHLGSTLQTFATVELLDCSSPRRRRRVQHRSMTSTAPNVRDAADRTGLRPVRTARSAVTRAVLLKPNPFWAEEFVVDVESRSFSVLRISVWRAHRLEEDQEIGRVLIPVRSLRDGIARAAWYPLFPAGSKTLLSWDDVAEGQRHITSSPGWKDRGCGAIRLELQCTQQRILPLSAYNEILGVVVNDYDLDVLRLLERGLSFNQGPLPNTLVRLSFASGRLLYIATTLVLDEIDSTNDPEVIFRGNSLATKFVDAMMKFVGAEYLRQVLGPVIARILVARKPCEIDPVKMENPTPSAERSNLKNLTKWVARFTAAIFSSAHLVPPEFGILFRSMREALEAKFSPEQTTATRYTSVTGFLFLRFFCPAIMGPSLFGLCDVVPRHEVSRALVLSAKVIQNLANLSEFSDAAEPCMQPLNGFLQLNQAKMCEFVDLVCNSDPDEKNRGAPTRPLESIRVQSLCAHLHQQLCEVVPGLRHFVDAPQNNTAENVQTLEGLRRVLLTLRGEARKPKRSMQLPEFRAEDAWLPSSEFRAEVDKVLPDFP